MRRDPATVSVVIPAYNAAEWIAETIESVLAQSYQPIEIVVVDDGSTDNTEGIIKQFAPQVVYVRQDNRGLAAARNAGIREARGQLIAFIDADDLWIPEKIELQVSMLSSRPEAAWAYCDAFVVDKSSRVILDRVGRVSRLPDGDITGDLLQNNFIASPTPIVRREAFEKVGGFAEIESLSISEDWDMWLRLAASFPAACVRKPLAKIRSHTGSMTGTMDLDRAYKCKLAVIDRAIRLKPIELTPLRTRATSNVQIGIGQWMLRRGDKRGASRMFMNAYRSDVSNYRAIAFLGLSLVPQAAYVAAAWVRRQALKHRAAKRSFE